MVEKVTIVCWKWKPLPDSPTTKTKTRYASVHVNALYKMLVRHVALPFRLICVTDDPSGINPEIEIVQLWNEFRDLGGCFSRLVCFKKDFKLFGDKFLSIDLDCVITGNIDHLLIREESFIVWQPDECLLSRRVVEYCGSLFLLQAGSYPEIHDTFDPSKLVLNKHGRYSGGTDQKQISKAVKQVPVFGQSDGIYNFMPDLSDMRGLPGNCCIVFFNGLYHPDDPGLFPYFPWVQENYPAFATGPIYYNHDQVQRKQVRIMDRNSVEKIAESVPVTYVLYWWGKWPTGETTLGLEYIEKLVNGLHRFTPPDQEYRIVLFTDKPQVIPELPELDVRTLEVPTDMRWNLKKMFMFSNKAGLDGVNICFDLDCVVIGDLSDLLRTAKTSGRQIVTCVGAYRKKAIGGSIVAFQSSDDLHKKLWQHLLENRGRIEETTKGSERRYYQQRFRVSQVGFWEKLIPGQVVSYKRDCQEFLPDSAVVVRFHGAPRPHEVREGWMKEYWR